MGILKNKDRDRLFPIFVLVPDLRRLLRSYGQTRVDEDGNGDIAPRRKNKIENGQILPSLK